MPALLMEPRAATETLYKLHSSEMGRYQLRDFERPEMWTAVEDWYRSLLRSLKIRIPQPKPFNKYAAMQVFKFGKEMGPHHHELRCEQRTNLSARVVKRLKPPTQLTASQFLRCYRTGQYLRNWQSLSRGGWDHDVFALAESRRRI